MTETEQKHLNNLRTCVNALRSYQYGNTPEHLAAEIANAMDAYIDAAIAAAEGEAE